MLNNAYEKRMNSPFTKFPMATKARGERTKGVRMDAPFIARIEQAGSLTGIRSFSDQVRHLITLGLQQIESATNNRSRKAA